MVPWNEHGAAQAGLDGPAAPLWRRLALAVAVSVALHAAVVLGVHPTGPRRIQFTPLMTARLSPLPPAAPLSAPSGELSVAAAPQPSSDTKEDKEEATPAATRADAPPEPEKPGWVQAPLPPRYYFAAELQRNPVPLQPVEAESPPEAGSAEGTVVLQVLIDEHGTVDAVTVVRAQPPEVFEKAAVAAFSRTRFSPGIRNGVPVKSQILVEMEFRNPNPFGLRRGY